MSDSPETPLERAQREERLSTLPRGDLDNARGVIARYGEDIIHVSGKGYFLYRDGYYQKDPDYSNLKRLIGEHAEAVAEALYARGGDDAAKQRTAMLRYTNERPITNTLNLLNAVQGVTVPASSLNQDLMLLNVRNGTIDLRSGDFRPHSRADRLTTIASVSYDPSAKCPMWIDFVNSICAESFGGVERPDLARFLQRLAGYLLTGKTSEHKVLLFWGAGRNGKTTWIEVISALLGPVLATTTDAATFMRTRSDQHPTAIADIAESRLCYAGELAEDAVINEERLKAMTGEERRKARFMHKDFFEFVPHFKVVFGTNHLPKVPTTDRAIWSRLIPVPFSATIPEKLRDTNIQSRLKSELPGILNWALEGCKMWQALGLDPNSVPCISKLREEYRAEEDQVSDILGQIAIFGPDYYVSVNDLYRAYQDACRRQGLRPLEKSVLSRRLKMEPWSNTVSSARREHGKVRVWRGLTLASDPTGFPSDSEEGDEEDSNG